MRLYGQTKYMCFTMVEMLIVMGVILVLAGLLLPAAMSSWQATDAGRAETTIRNLVIAMEQYKMQFAKYPDKDFHDRHDDPAALDGESAFWFTTDYINADGKRSYEPSFTTRHVDGLLTALKRGGFLWEDSALTRRDWGAKLPGETESSRLVLADPWDNPYRIAFRNDTKETAGAFNEFSSYKNPMRAWRLPTLAWVPNNVNPPLAAGTGASYGPPWSGQGASAPSKDVNNWNYWIGENVDYVIYSTGPRGQLTYPIFNAPSGLLAAARRNWINPKE